jgi:hypothetical protein
VSGGFLARRVGLVRAEHPDVRGEAVPVLAVAVLGLVAAAVAGAADGVSPLAALRDLALLTGLAVGAVVGVLLGAPGPRADAEAALFVPRRTGVVLARAASAAAAAAAAGLLCGLALIGAFVAARAVAGGPAPELETLGRTLPLAPALALASAPAAAALAVVLRGRHAATVVLLVLAAAAWGTQALAGSTGEAAPVASVLAALGPGGPSDGPAPWLVALLAVVPAVVLVPLAVVALRRRALHPEGTPS